MTDIARLQLRIESVEAELAARRLKDLDGAASKAEGASSRLMGSFTKLIAPVATLATAMAALNKLVSVQREFDVLNAGLLTATGSAENAAVAFEALQDFAKNTPYGLAQATEGFTKLVNLGLEPSERALMSYGNTAAAMGKDMSQMIEAVADATTGEFERLKEFGIKSSSEGDRVKFTFRGVTTEIGKNAAEIEQYLMALGENEFAGAMENRMNSLDGAIAGLGDSWDALWLTISQQGIGDLITDAVNMASAALEELTAMIASGEMEGYLDAIGAAWGGWGSDVMDTIDILTKLWKDATEEWGDEGESVVKFLIDAFAQFPQNVRAFIQIAVVEVASFFDRLVARAAYAKDAIKAIFSDDTIEAAGQRYAAQMEGIYAAREASLTDIMRERDVDIQASRDKAAAARKLREEYDRAAEARRGTGDRLARFRTGAQGSGEGAGDGGSSKASDAAAKAQQREFENLVASLRTEEEAIAESYRKRKEIIERNTGAGSQLRSDLMARLDKDNADQLARLQEQQNKEVESLRSQLFTEEEAIQESYNRRMQIIAESKSLDASSRAEMEQRVAEEREKALAGLEQQRQRERDSLYNGLLTEEEMLVQSFERKRQQISRAEEITELERQDLLRRLKQQFDDEMQQAEMARTQALLTSGEQLFGGLAGLAKSYAGEQSSAYRALFAVSKAFSVAQAALSISTGLAKAQELGFPANLAEMARVAATGASILGQINGANFAGAYDQGGQIPAGKIGLVGEYGPELIRGPATVTGRVATDRKLRENGGQDSGPAPAPVVNVRNINVLDPAVVGDYLGTDEGEQLIMNVVQRNQRGLGF
ncbi:tail tape measure protein [Pseudomonas phage PaMx11]|uniref:Tail tape measure protein n=1 Tax=Pseudomonas phage PaMx11 TaxID=1175657 RepID=A0A0S0MVE9_BPPAM|nr:tail length tape measure protein [Pseudomonas phage PaMx11]ALH23699.1 tail tape measure protein [Pseudomonas phage PaMx11]